MLTDALSHAGAGEAATIGEVIRRNATARPSNVALVAPEGRPLLYGDLLRNIVDITGRLRRAGVASNARVAISLPHGPTAAVAIVAAACGATAVPLDPRMTVHEIREILTTLQIAAVILPYGESPARRAAAGLAPAAPSIGARRGEVFDLMKLSQAPSAPWDRTPEQEAPAYILSTSGTTGRQKFVPFSHGSQIALSERIKSCFELTEEDRCLCLASIFYSLGLSMGVLTPLLVGGSIALPASPTKPDVTEWLLDLKPTWSTGGPTIYRALSEHAARTPGIEGKHSLRFLVSAGMALPEDVREGTEKALGVPVLEHYGMTETGMVATNRLPRALRKPGTAGVALPGILAIADASGGLLPPGETGEILVTGPTLMRGYLDDPQPYAERFINGWFRTGDLGSLDQEGFLTIQGRLKEVINRAGEKIIPQEIDAVLVRHPAVKEAAAFGIPHLRIGEQVAAAVVLRDGQRATASQLRKWMVTYLARFKIPRRILFVEELPRSLAGKVQRHELRRIADANAPSATAEPRAADEYRSITEGDLAHLWAAILKRDASIGLDDDFFAIGGDSILATEMLLELEQLAGTPLNDGILYEASTIRELARQLDTFAWSDHCPLVAVQKAGSQRPFFFCHGDYIGGGFYARRFARLLGPEQPFYVLPPPPLAIGAPQISMQHLAAEQLPLILETQPTGPLLLGGYCNGALLAFELARQSMAAGRQIDLIVMIDPPSFNPRALFRTGRQGVDGALQWAGVGLETRAHALAAFSSWVGNIWCNLERFVRAAPSDRLAMASRRLRRLRSGRRKLPLRTEREEAERLLSELTPTGIRTFRTQRPPDEVLDKRWHSLVANYVPARLDAPILIFSAVYSGEAWRSVCRHLDRVQLPPDHNACITSNLDLVASAVSDRLTA